MSMTFQQTRSTSTHTPEPLSPFKVTQRDPLPTSRTDNHESNLQEKPLSHAKLRILTRNHITRHYSTDSDFEHWRASSAAEREVIIEQAAVHYDAANMVMAKLPLEVRQEVIRETMEAMYAPEMDAPDPREALKDPSKKRKRVETEPEVDKITIKLKVNKVQETIVLSPNPKQEAKTYSMIVIEAFETSPKQRFKVGELYEECERIDPDRRRNTEKVTWDRNIRSALHKTKGPNGRKKFKMVDKEGNAVKRDGYYIIRPTENEEESCNEIGDEGQELVKEIEKVVRRTPSFQQG